MLGIAVSCKKYWLKGNYFASTVEVDEEGWIVGVESEQIKWMLGEHIETIKECSFIFYVFEVEEMEDEESY